MFSHFLRKFFIKMTVFLLSKNMLMTKSDSSKKSSMKNIPKKAMSKPKLNNATLRKRVRFKPGSDLAGKVK